MFKSGFVAINGRPNVGKSTLMNAILHKKVTIISPKAQTTRNKISGVYSDESTQIVFIDTPGIHKPQHRLGEVMNKMAFSAARDVEAIILICDASEEIGTGDEFIVDHFKGASAPIFLVLNKIDLLTHEELLHKMNLWHVQFKFDRIIPISALKNENIQVLLDEIKKVLPMGPKYYPDGMVSDHPESFIIGEFIREKVLLLTREEVPHSVAVVVEKIKKNKNNTIEVDATIIVERDSQKGIIIGNGGKMIKRIGTMARKDIENLLGSKIMLSTFVRVENNWRNEVKYLKEFGYKDE